MSEESEFMRALRQADWLPDAPSAECEEVLRSSEMPATLRPIDVIGIQWMQNVKRIHRRFGYQLGEKGFPQDELELVALRHVIRKLKVDCELTERVINELHADIARWHREEYQAAHAALAKEAPDAVGDEKWLERNRERFEPAITDALIDAQLGFTNIERDMKTMGLALAMYEEASIKPKGRDPATLRELIDYFGFLCEVQLIWMIDESGDIVLQPLWIKSALDKKAGRTPKGLGMRRDCLPDQPGSSESHDTSASSSAAVQGPIPRDRDEGAHARDRQETVVEEAGALDALVAVDLVRKFREVVEARRENAKAGSAKWWVLGSLETLVQGESTISELIAVSGLSSSVLYDAYESELAAAREALEAA